MARNSTLELLMFRAGFVPAVQAAKLVCVYANGVIYRAIEEGRLKARRHGSYWFVQLASLLKLYGDNPAVAKQIKEWRPCVTKPSKPKRRVA